MIIRRLPLIVFLLFHALCLVDADQPLSAQAPYGNTKGAPPPRIALVLSGGGALGFAHNGVLQVLEELGIPIDMVVGTSMGAIIGGFYSVGYSPADIEAVTGIVDWALMFSDTVERHYYRYRERLISERYFIDAGFDRDGIHLGGGLIAGQNITALFERLTLRIADNIDFDELPRSFRAIAADVITGEEVVLSSGSVADAMRASMTIPGLLSPYQLDGRYLIDGGVVNNMPVDVARAMGADIVIAVEVREPLPTPVDRLARSPLASIDQSTKIMIEANVRPQRALADVVVVPDLQDFSRTGFNDALVIMQRGAEAARAMLPALEQLADAVAERRPLEFRRSAQGEYFTSTPKLAIDHVRIDGGSPLEREIAARRFERFTGSAIEPDDLIAPVDEIYTLGQFDLVKTQVERDSDHGNTLVVTLVPRKVSRNTIRLGLRYAGMISSSAYSKMVITQNLTISDIIGRGSYWSTELSFVNTLGLATLYFQPLGANFFLQPYLSYVTDSDSYTLGSVGTVIEYQEASGGVDLGLLPSRYAELRLGYRFSLFKSPLTELEDDREWATMSAWVASIGADSRDSRLFPRRGSAGEIEYQIALPIGDDSLQFQRLEFGAEKHLPLSARVSLGFRVAGGTDFTDTFDERRSLRRFNSFALADERVFIGYKNDPLRGRHRLAAGGELRIAPAAAAGVLSAHPVIALDGGVVDAWNEYPSRSEDLTVNWSVSLGVGARFSDAFGILLRAGVVRDARPFLALNLGAFGL